MALTKLPKNAFGTDSVDDTKIEDGTIQNQEISGTLPETKLATGTIENASLSNSTITINGTSISLGGSSSVGVEVNWQSVITADGSTATTGVAGNGYFIDTTSAAHTFNLPASASLGDQIAIKDYAGTFSSNNLTIGRNGHNIQGVANDSLISTNRASLLLVYVDSTKGWIYAEESNVADLQAATFITATGGTITTSGDFKIHSFTGDGCFVVSTSGNGPTVPTGGPTNVDYLIVAGGGAGGAGAGGGGGAGGYRTTFPSPGCNAGSFPITTTTYPITVGAGGAAPANCGSDSIFSTITSAGGGAGRPGGNPGFAGGSGGGGGFGGPTLPGPPTSGGGGNSPPVSPPQGNPGTGGPNGNQSAGAGGGAGAAASGINGGNGLSNSITGSSVTYAGGAGGGSNDSYPSTPPGGSGGTGGGGDGGGGPAFPKASNGTANLGGGGGGGGGGGCSVQGSGGKGIVIIRYKFQ